MKIIKNYKHSIASHCESGTVRNVLRHAGLDVSEPLLFGIGSGIAFAYLSMIKGVGGFPVAAIRMPMGAILNNVDKLCGIKFYNKKLKTTDEALKIADQLIDSGIPAAICVDMYYMKYLPPFMQVHVPFHFVVLVGKSDGNYAISDPYYQGIGVLSEENVRLAWETHALFAENNLLAYVKYIPKNIDWESAIVKALGKTCNNMLLAPGIRQILPIFGVEGIKTFAKKMLLWPKKYSGLSLREGMLFTPTILEEQGTGGGAFRMIYGAFLQEAADILNSKELNELADRMIENGEQWREASRELIKIGKTVPVNNSEYSDWFLKNEGILNDSLKEVSNKFIERANIEDKFFKDLKKIIPNLKK